MKLLTFRDVMEAAWCECYCYCATTCLKCHQSWAVLKLAIWSCQGQVPPCKQRSTPSRSLQLLSWRAHAWWEPELNKQLLNDCITELPTISNQIAICHAMFMIPLCNRGSWILESKQMINWNMLQKGCLSEF